MGTGARSRGVGAKLDRGQPLDHYLQTLESVRTATLQNLANVSTEWLDISTPWNGYPANNYFKWFHVMEDEVNHRGQIRWLRRRLSLSDR